MGEDNGCHSPLTMTRDEVAKELQVTRKSVDRYVKDGRLPKPYRLGKSVRFLRSEVLGCLEKSRETVS